VDPAALGVEQREVSWLRRAVGAGLAPPGPARRLETQEREESARVLERQAKTPAVARQRVPARNTRLVIGELAPALLVVTVDARELVRGSELVAAAGERQAREAARSAVLVALEIEGEEPAVARPVRIRRAATLVVEQVARAARVAQHHQAAPGAELDEAARLVRHVDGVRCEPVDQRGRGTPEATAQAREVVVRERDAQLATARAAAVAAEREVLGATHEGQRRSTLGHR
jgi:hypothetical protein